MERYWNIPLQNGGVRSNITATGAVVAPLVGRRTPNGISGLDCRAFRQECVGHGGSTIILKWPQSWPGLVGLIALFAQAAGVGVLQVMSLRNQRCGTVSRSAGDDDGILHRV